MPHSARSRVDLPAPLRPTTASTDPRGTVNDTSRRAGTTRTSARRRDTRRRRSVRRLGASRRTRYDAERPWTSTAGGPGSVAGPATWLSVLVTPTRSCATAVRPASSRCVAERRGDVGQLGPLRLPHQGGDVLAHPHHPLLGGAAVRQGLGDDPGAEQ